MNWTLWQNILSPHLSSVARALASIPDQTVTVVAEHELPDRRRATGWRTPDCAPAHSLIRPTDADVERLIEGNGRESSVHLINGLAGVPLNRRVLPRLVRTEATVGLISESADDRGIFGLARKAKYRLDRYRVGRNLDFILAMGQLGVRWFESAGYDSSKVFPFAYLTERPVGIWDNSDEEKEHAIFRILYLGQIIRRKDGVTAIRGLEKLSARDWQFDIVGNGPDLRRWRQVARECGVAESVHFRPAVDNRLIGSLLRRADLLLLPSRRDGWGAVVNEALMSGVPVSAATIVAPLTYCASHGGDLPSRQVRRKVYRAYCRDGSRCTGGVPRSPLRASGSGRPLWKDASCTVPGRDCWTPPSRGPRPLPPWY